MNRIIPCLVIHLALLSDAFSVDYHTDVAPLLRDYCAGCHNEFDLEGEFSVETFASLMKGGETEDEIIVAPGKPDASFLLRTIQHDADPAMPPKKEPQPTAEEIAVIQQWIQEGAKGPAVDADVSILSTLTVPDIAPSGKAVSPITAAEYSPDGRFLAIAQFATVELRDVKSGKTLRRFPVTDGKVNAVHFSNDGKLLVTASGITGLKGVATIWNVASGKEVRRIGEDSHRDILFDAEFSPDDKLLATAGYDRVIRLWDVETGKYLRQFPSHNGAVYDLAFSPDGKVLASASGDSTGKVWHVETGKRLDTLNQPQGEQLGIDFTPDGKYIVGVGADNRIRLWRFLSKDQPRINPVVHARFGHEDAIIDMAISSDGKWLATSSADRALKLWSLPDLKQVESFGEQEDVVEALAFLPSGKAFMAARMNGSISDYTVAAPRKVAAKGKAAQTRLAAPELVEGKMVMLKEAEGGELQKLTVPSRIDGMIGEPGDVDEFVFSAKAGEEWIFEIDAEKSKSKLDSKIAVLNAEGEPVERVVLQAVRDSWLTFRGKDSKASGDFRVQNWSEMELNEFLYVNGEVVKLWHYPRGPDSGFLVYPGFGSRHTFFDTTPMAHPVGQPCYIVRAFPAGTEPSPNGLPVYRIFYENDDESRRMAGKDSKLSFVAPKDGDFRIAVADVRGSGGADFHYKLTARRPNPDFSVEVGGKNPKVSPGSGKELSFTVKRMDGFDGPIDVVVEGLPETLSVTSPLTVEREQDRGFAMLNATADFAGLTEEEAKKIKVVAKAKVGGKAVAKSLGDLGKLEKGPEPKMLISIEPDGDNGKMGEDGVLEFTLHPGETITANVVVDRLGFEPRIDFGKEDSGRNLPHGVYVDNIGLNGLMIPVGKSEQRFFLTASEVAGETTRLFHLRSTSEGKEGARPVRLRVVAKDGDVVKN